MRYVSAFSGIEAASVAWHPLGWQAIALIEFDAFPSAVLAHHYPNTPNLGDITKVTEDQVKGLGPVDVFVFGSPCQDLSVAGKRKGLDGERSGLFFDAMRLVRWLREHCGLRWAVWENVPGAFSSNEGRDFAAVVAALGGFEFVDVPPKGWGTEGAADGPQALVEWSTLDAQWFGVAQRRRRCFAVADFGDWTGRQPVLLEPDRLRGDSAPSREAGKATTTCTLRSTDGGSDVDHARGNQLVRVTVMAHGQGGAEVRDDGGAPCLTCNHEAPIAAIPTTAHTLRGEGFDASEDGTGRGTPLVPDIRYAYYSHDYANDRITDPAGVNPALTANASSSGNLNVLAPVLPFDTTQVTSATNRSNPLAAGAHAPAIAFTQGEQHGRMDGGTPQSQDDLPAGAVRGLRRCECGGASQERGLEGSPTGEPSAPVQELSHEGASVGSPLPAVREAAQGAGLLRDALPATEAARRPGIQTDSTCLHCGGLRVTEPLNGVLREARTAGETGHSGDGSAHQERGGFAPMAVRRLTPVECERLQGFPDNWTLIPWRKKPASECPDGPRYKALGNSMAVPVMRWIGRQIDFAHRFF